MPLRGPMGFQLLRSLWMDYAGEGGSGDFTPGTAGWMGKSSVRRRRRISLPGLVGVEKGPSGNSTP